MNANRSSAFRLSLPLDRIGASTSLLCAIHCAALPFVVTLLPILGLGFLASEAFEWGLVAAAVALATVSLALGYRKHRSIRVLALASGAILLLIAGRLAEHHDWSISGAVLAVLGGVALAAGHYVNYRLSQSCQRCKGNCSAVQDEPRRPGPRDPELVAEAGCVSRHSPTSPQRQAPRGRPVARPAGSDPCHQADSSTSSFPRRQDSLR